MTFAITDAIRTSGFNDEPVVIEFSYTGAVSTVEARINKIGGGFDVLATGGSGSGTITPDLTASTRYDPEFKLPAMCGGSYGLYLIDTGAPSSPSPVWTVNLQYNADDVAALYTQTGPRAFDFTPKYFDGVGYFSDNPFDFWIGLSPPGISLLGDGRIQLVDAQSSQIQLGAERVSLLWDFGDGATSTSTTPSHTYSADGLYSASLSFFYDTGITPSPKTFPFYIYIPATPAGWYLHQVGMAA